MKTKLLGLVVLGVLMGACRGHDGNNGTNGSNGSNGQAGGTGPGGPVGPPGLPGPTSTIPFSYDGSYSFPQVTVSQTIPGLDLSHGDIINVYISWQGQPWTQIGSTWVG